MARSFFWLFCLLMLAAGLAFSQSAKDKEQLLEAVRSGKVKVTDDLIDAQRKSHPELKGFTNQEIRDKIEAEAAASGESKKEDASEKPSPPSPEEKKQRMEKSAPNDSRFPKGLARFGYDFFANNYGEALGDNNLPALPEYILSPGDEIQIYTWGRENQSQTVIIDNEGMLHYPPLQPMRLAGNT